MFSLLLKDLNFLLLSKWGPGACQHDVNISRKTRKKSSLIVIKARPYLLVQTLACQSDLRNICLLAGTTKGFTYTVQLLHGANSYLYNLYFQFLIIFTCFARATTGFLYAKCFAPPPCTCIAYGIYCDNKHLSKVPAFTIQGEHYSNIDVELHDNQFTTIPAYAFKNLSAINATYINIDLYNNRISTIDILAFSGIENVVTTINLENNSLTHLPMALKALSSLYSLYLVGNPIVNIDTSILASFSSTLNLFSISIGRFTSFPGELQILTALRTLAIHDIKSPTLNSTVFYSVEKNLTYLETAYTYFDHIPAAICRLQYLRFFTADHSANLSRHTESIFDECNNTMPNLISLSLQYDQLTTIPKLGSIFPKLNSLNLFGNEIHFIESSAFSGMTVLTRLNIGGNRLTRIPFAVNEAIHLGYLHVEHNKIDTVENLDLSNLHYLYEIILDGNPLVYISPYSLRHMPLLNSIKMRSTDIGYIPRALLGIKNLHAVYLSGKPIDCSCQTMDYLKSWNVTEVYIYATCSSCISVRSYLISDLPICP